MHAVMHELLETVLPSQLTARRLTIRPTGPDTLLLRRIQLDPQARRLTANTMLEILFWASGLYYVEA
jgi:hypothetical protein